MKINGRRIRLEHLEENWKKYFRSNMVCSFDDSKLYLLVEGKVCRELLVFLGKYGILPSLTLVKL